MRIISSFGLLWPFAFAIAPLFAVRSEPPSVLHRNHALVHRVFHPPDGRAHPRRRHCATVGREPPPHRPVPFSRFGCAAAVAAVGAPPSVGPRRLTSGAVPPLQLVEFRRRASSAAPPLRLRHLTVRALLRASVAAPPSVGGRRRISDTASPPPLHANLRRRYRRSDPSVAPSVLRCRSSAGGDPPPLLQYRSSARASYIISRGFYSVPHWPVPAVVELTG